MAAPTLTRANVRFDASSAASPARLPLMLIGPLRIGALTVTLAAVRRAGHGWWRGRR